MPSELVIDPSERINASLDVDVAELTRHADNGPEELHALIDKALRAQTAAEASQQALRAAKEHGDQVPTWALQVCQVTADGIDAQDGPHKASRGVSGGSSCAAHGLDANHASCVALIR